MIISTLLQHLAPCTCRSPPSLRIGTRSSWPSESTAFLMVHSHHHHSHHHLSTMIAILTIIMNPIMIIISAIVVIIIKTSLLVNVLYTFSFIWQLLLSTLELCPSLNTGNHNITQMTTMTMKAFSRIIWFVQPSQPSAAKTRRHRRSGHFTLSQKLDLQSW